MGSIFWFDAQNMKKILFYKNGHNLAKCWRIFNFLEAFLKFWEWVRRWHWPFWKIFNIEAATASIKKCKKSKYLKIMFQIQSETQICIGDLLTEFSSKKIRLDLQHIKKLRHENLLIFGFLQKFWVSRTEMDSGGSI